MQINWELITKNLKKIQINYSIIQSNVNSKISPLINLILEEYMRYAQDIDVRKMEVNDNYFEFSDTIEIVKDFFKRFDMEIYNKFVETLQNKEQIQIDFANIGENILRESNVTNNKMYLLLYKNTDDKYIVSHEFMHKIFSTDFNTKNSLVNLNRQMVTEINSLTIEKILNDKEQDNLFLRNRAISDFSKVIVYEFIDWMCQIYQKYGIVNHQIFANEFYNIKDKNKKESFYKYMNCMIPLIQNDTMQYQIVSFRYIIGSVLSSTLLYRLKDNKINTKDYIKMMKNLVEINTYEEALDIMNLNYLKNPEILDEIKDSYRKNNKKIFIGRDDIRCVE